MVAKLSVAVDQRHARRALTADEAGRLIDAASRSGTEYRGLTGCDRHHLYLLALATAFRREALASLTPEAFDFDAIPPVVILSAAANKNGKRQRQPLPDGVVDAMRGYLIGKPKGKPVFAGTWSKGNTADMIRLDMVDADIPPTTTDPDGTELHFDFHGLRHSVLTLLGQHGADLRTIQEIAGHGSPIMTARYAHKTETNLAAAMNAVPRFAPIAAASESPRV